MGNINHYIGVTLTSSWCHLRTGISRDLSKNKEVQAEKVKEGSCHQHGWVKGCIIPAGCHTCELGEEARPGLKKNAFPSATLPWIQHVHARCFSQRVRMQQLTTAKNALSSSDGIMSVIARKSWGKPPIKHPRCCWWPARRCDTRPGIAAEGIARPKAHLFVFVQLFLCTRWWAEDRKGGVCAQRRVCKHDGCISKFEEPTCMIAGTLFLHTMHTCQCAQRPFTLTCQTAAGLQR